MTFARGIRIGMVAAALVAATGAAARAADDLPPAIEGVPAARRSQPLGNWFVSIGPRVSLLRSAGYDPFSSNDVFTQFSATGLRSFTTGPRLATAAGLQWDSGTASAQARGAASSLALSRVAAVVEERFVARRWLYGFGRLAPGWLYGSASLDDQSAVARLGSSFSSFSLDASGGVAGRLNPAGQAVGLWVAAEAGYGWAPSRSLDLKPSLPEADASKAGLTPFVELAPRGTFFRFSVALDY